jgi:hypothetical protein
MLAELYDDVSRVYDDVELLLMLAGVYDDIA